MGRKQIWAGKHIYFCIAGLILLSFPACNTLERTKVTVTGSEYLLPCPDDGKEPSVQKDDQGPLKESQKPPAPPAERVSEDEVLFSTGLIYVQTGVSKKDHGQSLHLFKKLIQDFPQSTFVEAAKAMIIILQENEKLRQSVENLNQVNEKLKQSVENLNQMIEKSKQVDIQIEEKKREQKGTR